MERGVWVVRNGQLIPRHLATPLHAQFGTAPGVITDSMGSTLNHADGKRYDSKRAYEKAVRRAGCEIVGNEKQPERRLTPMSDPSDTIKQAIEQIESRAPMVRRSKKKGRA